MQICFPDYDLIYGIRDGLDKRILKDDFHLLVGAVVNWKLSNFLDWGNTNINEIIENIIEEIKTAKNGYFTEKENELREVLNCYIKGE